MWKVRISGIVRMPNKFVQCENNNFKTPIFPAILGQYTQNLVCNVNC